MKTNQNAKVQRSLLIPPPPVWMRKLLCLQRSSGEIELNKVVKYHKETGLNLAVLFIEMLG